MVYTRIHLFLSFAIVLIVMPEPASGQHNWHLNISGQYTSGTYTYETPTTSYVLYGGLRYQTNRWYASIDFSGFAHNSELVNRSGDMFLPGGHGSGNNGMHPGGHRMTESGTSFTGGFGDIFLRGEYTILSERSSLPSFSINGLIKIPVAHTGDRYGTGEFDLGVGIVLRKRFGQFVTFLDLGYVALGEPDDFTYDNPVSYGIGAGRFFQNGRYSVLAYYRGYSKIIAEYEPPQQLSIGLNIRMSGTTTISATGSYGLTETSPDVGVSVGMNIAL
jgi:hypothetical protein